MSLYHVGPCSKIHPEFPVKYYLIDEENEFPCLYQDFPQRKNCMEENTEYATAETHYMLSNLMSQQIKGVIWKEQHKNK